MSTILLLSAFSQQPRNGQLSVEPYSLTTFDGQQHSAELDRLWVPENRRVKSGRLIQIAFIRLKSSSAQSAAPIVFLSGGPGVPASVMGRVPVYYNLFEKLLRTADVILLDQRGSGLSSPNLSDCPAPGKLPADTFATAENFAHALAQATADCAAYWRSKGVDLTGYNTEESADDIEDLREALGVPHIDLLAHSYGTELALSAMRRHGDSVQRAVLASTEGPGDHDTAPLVWDLQLRKISDLVANDQNLSKDIPDLFSLFSKDAQNLDSHPLAITIMKRSTKNSITLTVGGVALRFITERMLVNGRAVPRLPALLQTIDAGDDSLLQQQVDGLYNDFDAGITLMGRTMTCSAGTPPARLLQAESEARTSLFGNASRIDLQPEVCQAAVGTFSLGPEYFAPLYSRVPVLFLSGTLDPDTPPMKAERIRWGFPHSTHIIVENGFHETLPDNTVQAIIVDFFKGEDVSDRHVSFSIPHFLSVDEAKQSQGPPR